MGVAAPHREAQVIANQRANTPALDLKLDLTLTRSEMLMLTGHSEQVAFVIMQHFAIRTRPQQAVTVAAIRREHNHAARHHGIEPLCLLAQPLGGRAAFGLSKGTGLHAEAGGEHLRQDHQVSANSLLEQLVEMIEVGLTVMPGQRGLHQRYV